MVRCKEVDQITFNEHLRESELYYTIDMAYEQFRKSGLKTQPYTRFLSVNQVNTGQVYVSLTYKIGGTWVSVKTREGSGS